CFFLFYCSVLLLYLHSFPTRRSSDLFRFSCVFQITERRTRRFRAGRIEKMTNQLSVESLASSQIIRNPVCNEKGYWAGAPGVFRSEEHTSELQSRSDLVCRLLLEKKK